VTASARKASRFCSTTSPGEGVRGRKSRAHFSPEERALSQQFRTSFSIAQERGAHEHGFEERRAPPDSQAAPRYARSEIPGYRIEKKAAKRQLLARRIPAFMNHLVCERAQRVGLCGATISPDVIGAFPVERMVRIRV